MIGGHLLRHTIEVIADVVSAPLDPDGEDRGHAGTIEATVDAFRGSVQPRTARERASVASADVAIGTHRIYLEPTAIGLVDADMRLRKIGDPDPDLNGVYRIVGPPANAAGRGVYLGIDAERIEA